MLQQHATLGLNQNFGPGIRAAVLAVPCAYTTSTPKQGAIKIVPPNDLNVAG